MSLFRVRSALLRAPDLTADIIGNFAALHYLQVIQLNRLLYYSVAAERNQKKCTTTYLIEARLQRDLRNEIGMIMMMLRSLEAIVATLRLVHT